MALLAAREEAQMWALEFVSHEAELTQEVFKKELLVWFASQSSILEAMARFFATEACCDGEGYKTLLKDADVLTINGAIKIELLVKNLIARSPVDIKAILNS